MAEVVPRREPPVEVVKAKRRPRIVKPIQKPEPAPPAWPFRCSSRGWHRRPA